MCDNHKNHELIHPELASNDRRKFMQNSALIGGSIMMANSMTAISATSKKCAAQHQVQGLRCH